MSKKYDTFLKVMLIYYFVFFIVSIFGYAIINNSYKEYLNYFIFLTIFIFLLPYNIKYTTSYLKQIKIKKIHNLEEHFSKYKSINKYGIKLLKNKNLRNNQNYIFSEKYYKKIYFYYEINGFSNKKFIKVNFIKIKNIRFFTMLNILKIIGVLIIVIILGFLHIYGLIIALLILFFIIGRIYDLIFSFLGSKKYLFTLRDNKEILIFKK